MRRVALAAVVLAACAHAPAPAPSPIERVAGHEAKRVSLSLTDALGEPVRLGPGQPRASVVVFMSKASSAESAELLRKLDEQAVTAPIDQVGVVDVARYSGFVRRIAERRLRQSLEEGRVKRRRRRLALGLDASQAIVDRWHLIGDFDGAVLEAFGVQTEPKHPVAFVVDRSGAVSGPYYDLQSLLGAVGAATGSPASAAHSGAAARASSVARSER